MFLFHVTFFVKPEERDAMIKEILDQKIMEGFRDVDGITFYQFHTPIDIPNVVFLTSKYRDQAAIDYHTTTEVAQKWHDIRGRYVYDKITEKFVIED